MEPQVFEAMLTFIYTDAWPEEAQMDDEEDACVMAQRLLVAADKYGLESLKSMREEKLCNNHIDTSSAAAILELAEQHCCPGLKEACLEFLGSPAALLAVIETIGFEYLAQSCPSAAKELMISVILSHDLKKVMVSRGVACSSEDNAKVEEGVPGAAGSLKGKRI
jgi:speckle-type POZ protein